MGDVLNLIAAVTHPTGYITDICLVRDGKLNIWVMF
jgi:hypothetical protein